MTDRLSPRRPALPVKFAWRGTTGPLSVEDYRKAARRAVPEMVWAYIDGGADDLVTLQANRSAFDRWRLRPRVLTGKEGNALGTDVCGESLRMPILLAPTGMSGLAHWAGERGAAQAAESRGTRAIISTAASYTPEEIAAATSEHHFFQLYPWANLATGARALTESFIRRAHHCGYAGLFVTVDVPVRANRERERRTGMGTPPVLTPGRILNAAVKPRWSYGFLKHKRIAARLLVDEGGTGAAVESAKLQMRLMRPELTWDDFSWMREKWKRPLFIKGILDPADAVRAVELGADGVVVSNHGGRQLDGAEATLDALPAVVEAVGHKVPVMLDGGIRRGSDVVKALCLGAASVAIGRPYLYGLAARGREGVEHVLDILYEEISRTMTLIGCESVDELTRDRIVPAAGP